MVLIADYILVTLTQFSRSPDHLSTSFFKEKLFYIISSEPVQGFKSKLTWRFSSNFDISFGICLPVDKSLLTSISVFFENSDLLFFFFFLLLLFFRDCKACHFM